MNTEIQKLFDSAPNAIKEGAAKTAKLYRDMLFAERQRNLWVSRADMLKESHRIASLEYTTLLTRWDRTSNEIELLEECP